VQSALAKVEGVKNVKVDLKSGKASVVTDKGKVSPEQLIQAVAGIEGGQYKATAK
jgi:copper chaperone CopZ|tara:strand:- start:521 stop:685 length:165 start_codon:yes stop_codon:yes gene_type:complete